MPALQPAKLLRLYLAERVRSIGRPLYEVIVEKCREMQIAGATVLRADEGFGSGPEIHRARLLAHDRPIEITIVDDAAKIAALMPVLESLMHTGTMVVSDVQIVRFRKEVR
jgi:PII-like signaling protein